MPVSGYVIKEEEFESMHESKSRLLNRKEIEQYMSMIGCLIWVAGGSSKLQVTAYTDASLGTAAKGRSVLGHLVKLNAESGAIHAKATASQSVHLSSFEAELD
eukprot:gene20585-26386_t